MDAHADPTVAFGCILQKLRKDAKLSQEKLAFAADLDRTYISLLERGQRQPTLKTLFALSAVLNIPPHQIIQMVEETLCDPLSMD